MEVIRADGVKELETQKKALAAKLQKAKDEAAAAAKAQQERSADRVVVECLLCMMVSVCGTVWVWNGAGLGRQPPTRRPRLRFVAVTCIVALFSVVVTQAVLVSQSSRPRGPGAMTLLPCMAVSCSGTG